MGAHRDFGGGSAVPPVCCSSGWYRQGNYTKPPTSSKVYSFPCSLYTKLVSDTHIRTISRSSHQLPISIRGLSVTGVYAYKAIKATRGSSKAYQYGQRTYGLILQDYRQIRQPGHCLQELLTYLSALAQHPPELLLQSRKRRRHSELIRQN